MPWVQGLASSLARLNSIGILLVLIKNAKNASFLAQLVQDQIHGFAKHALLTSISTQLLLRRNLGHAIHLECAYHISLEMVLINAQNATQFAKIARAQLLSA